MDQCKRNYLTIDGHQLAISLNENFKPKSVLTVNAIGCRMWQRMGKSDDDNTVNLAETSGGVESKRRSAESTKRKAKAKYLKKRKVCERKVLRVPCATYPR
jgi:hypothetical protein